jgi:hypothetical protein
MPSTETQLRSAMLDEPQTRSSEFRRGWPVLLAAVLGYGTSITVLPIRLNSLSLSLKGT